MFRIIYSVFLLAAVSLSAGENKYKAAYDNLGVGGKSPHLWSDSASYHFGEGSVPLSACDKNAPARTIAYDGKAVILTYDGARKGASYLARLTFLSDNSDRSVSVLIDGSTALQSFKLPAKEVLIKEIGIPATALADGSFSIAINKTGGANAVLSEVTIFSDLKHQLTVKKKLHQDTPAISVAAVELAIKDLKERFGTDYPDADKYLEKLQVVAKMAKGEVRKGALYAIQRQALLANPLLKKFEKIVAIRRKYDNNSRKIVYTRMPNMNTYSLEAVSPVHADDELVTLSDFTGKAKIDSLYRPAKGGAINEIDLGFDGKKIMYSGLGSENNWHLHEIGMEGKYLRQLTPTGVDYSSFDSCYLPDGRIVYTSTAPDQGLPCEAGRVRMSNTFLLDPATQKIRRLTFDQDSNWGPTVMEDGRVMFMRWEYSDVAHFFSRMIMTMNPDGTVQRTHYGSNGYWPNSYGRIKPIPGAPSQFISTLGGHHSGRPGPLCLFDVSKGRSEEKGAVQMIPGYGKKIKPVIQDYLYAGTYPKFQNPIPLGTNPSDGAGTYFLVSCKPTKQSLWGIYLVDRFDNIVKIVEQQGYALNEPIPVMKTKRPPVIPDRNNPESKTATVYVANIYEGPTLKNIPVGKVKKLRLFTYHYSYYKAGSHEVVGCEASWDVKRVLGTVPVEADGSVSFEIPANTPISIQPLDENGAAIALMRSWFVGMPGEFVSCIGCHEDQNKAVASARRGIASRKAPSKIQNWQGEARNFGFMKEVQPVLNKHCISCHNAETTDITADNKVIPDFATLKLEKLVYQDMYKNRGDAGGGPFPVSYNNLNPYVRRPGPEGNYRLPDPMEFHVSSSFLIQHLGKGHHGVNLSVEEWEKINAWVDLNVPCWSSWTDSHRYWANTFTRAWAGGGNTHDAQLKTIEKYQKRRIVVQKLYADVEVDLEADQYSYDQAVKDLAKITPIKAQNTSKDIKIPNLKNWPVSAAKIKAMQADDGNGRIEIEIPGGKLAFRKIPTGSFVMGGGTDATPRVVKVEKDYWIAEFELTNTLYHQFDKKHSSRFMDQLGKDQTTPGINANKPELPAIRVSWNEAVAYTKWLSKKTGKKFRLPTEKEWEYAARAGSNKPFYWGDTKADFGKFANLADKTMEKFNARQTFNYHLRVTEVNDKAQIQTKPGSYKPNAFGLYDMIGNVAEWTQSDYKDGKKVSKGGSWRDLPRWTPVWARVPYQPYQKVYNVGIRLVLEE